MLTLKYNFTNSRISLALLKSAELALHNFLSPDKAMVLRAHPNILIRPLQSGNSFRNAHQRKPGANRDD